MIFPCTRGLKTREVAGVIAPLCRAIDPVIIVRTGEGDGLVSVSPPHLRPPISLRSPRHCEAFLGPVLRLEYSHWPQPHPRRIWMVPFPARSFSSPLFGLLCLPNLCICMAWLYHRATGPPWNLTSIAGDLEWTVGSMHIQAISVPDGSRFTLSTFRMSVTPVRRLSIQRRSFLRLSP
jgi:hypothetical protein